MRLKALFLSAFLLACKHHGPPVALHTGPAGATSADYAERIADPAAWSALAASPHREMFAHTEVVKVIVDLEDNWRTYFLQSRRWEIHYYFASRFLARPGHPVEDHAAFNIREYRRPDRRFALGTLVHYRDSDTWTYELVAGDTLDIPRTARLFRRVREAVYFGDRLRYRPIPAQHQAAEAALRAENIPLVSTDDVRAGVVFEPINPGMSYGYLRFIHGDPDPARVRRTDIVVLDTVPLDLPVCAGIITSERQAPLGHLGVLAANRGTPDMTLREASTSPTLRALEGRLVRLHVTPQNWSIEAATQADAERAWEADRPREVFSPQRADRDPGLPDVATLHWSDVDVAGAKAAQFGELAHIGPPVVLPRAFVVPFAAYDRHMARAGATRMLSAMLANPAMQADPARRAEFLAQLRAAIERAEVDPALVALIQYRAATDFPGRRVRLRSSTNAEDLPGFNGAGLYRSVVIPASPSAEQVATALREVWSSLWAVQGYEERAYFRIDPTRVAMAVLVQESIDDDAVDGVAITANPFNEGRPAYFINAQIAGNEGGAVTSARGDEVPEQLLWYTYGEQRELERVAQSTRANGAQVLRDDEVERLAQTLRAIQMHFHPLQLEGSADAMDVEFILAGPTRRLVIVQARPYTMRWNEGRTMAEAPDGVDD